MSEQRDRVHHINESLLDFNSERDTATPVVINVKDYGAVGDNTHDDTININNALAAIAAASVESGSGIYMGSQTALYFPAGDYKISSALSIPSSAVTYLNIWSDGKAIIHQTTSTADIFDFNPVYVVSIHDLKFYGGNNQLNFQNSNTNTTMIDVSRCEFHSASGFAIYTAGTAVNDGHMSANLLIEDCKFYADAQVLRNACDNATVRNSWVSVSPSTASAAFVNNSFNGSGQSGGSAGTPVLQFDHMFGVVMTSPVTNARWVDNYGSFYATNSRFGGEGGGMPIVWHYAGPGLSTTNPMGETVSIDRSIIVAGQAGSGGALWLKTDVPRQIRIVGNTGLTDNPYVRAKDSVCTDCVDLVTYFNSYTNQGFAGMGQGNGWVDWFRFVFDPNMSSINVAYPPYPYWLEPYRDGKTSIFPTGTRPASTPSGGSSSCTFDLPASRRTWTALLTISTNPNLQGHWAYRATSTYFISQVDGWSGSAVIDSLSYQLAYQPTTPGGFLPAPSITSLVYNTGGATRPLQDGGTFIVTFNNSTGTPRCSLDLLHRSE